MKEFNQFLAILNNETDRGSALCAAAFAEDILERVIVSFLADVPTTNELFSGPSAAIGTFSNKIKFATSLGICSIELARSLNALRKIRNEFAHTWEPVSFENQRLADIVNNIQNWPDSEKLPLPETVSVRWQFDRRSSFILLQLFLLIELSTGSRLAPAQAIRFGPLYSSLEEARSALNKQDDNKQ